MAWRGSIRRRTAHAVTGGVMGVLSFFGGHHRHAQAQTRTPATTGTPEAAGTPPPHCDSLAHVGDSLTWAASADLSQEYRRLGWHDVQVNAMGGRGIASFMFVDITGLQAVQRIKAGGFDGCWVMALGTNDTANTKHYAHTPAQQKAWRVALVKMMMAELDGAPVMWVNTHLVRPGDDFSAAEAAAWNAVLTELQPSYPNMLIFDWNSLAAGHPEWTTTDLVHDTPIGSAQRAAFVAQAATLMLRDGILPADTPSTNRHPWATWRRHVTPRHHTGGAFRS